MIGSNSVNFVMIIAPDWMENKTKMITRSLQYQPTLTQSVNKIVVDGQDNGAQ